MNERLTRVGVGRRNGHSLLPCGLVLTAVFAVACGGVGVNAPPAQSVASAPSAADVAATERAALASRYLALAGPLNVKVRAIGKRIDQAKDLEAMHEISLDYAAVEEELSRSLGGLTVPDEVKPAVLAAIAAADEVAVLNRRAAAGDDARKVGVLLSVALDSQRAALGRLRYALGLGPVPAG